ncbi:MAG: lipoate--protein ligase family protein [Candidatus Undinarchaeales archaeon]|nr:lipoate--protein ligase family protein [Candidatus Undinarchaeales archaeon]
MRVMVLDDHPPSELLAMDEALATSIGSGTSPPTLKLAVFPSPTVSVGRFKGSSDIDLDVCNELGIPVLRRPSGGGSVLHNGAWDLTYCVIVPLSHQLSISVAKGFEHLCAPLVSALDDFDINARMNEFGDLIVGHRKIAGAAQIRRRNALVVHGYLMVDTDLGTLFRVLHKPDESLTRKGLESPSWATTLTAEGISTSVPEVWRSVVRAFGDTMDLEITPSNPTVAECDNCRELAQKYASDKWSLLRG